MRVRPWLRSMGPRAYWEVVAIVALLTALLLAATDRSAGGPPRAVAALLLIAVGGACIQAGLDRRDAAHHDSIRADIAATGGLAKRLSV